MRARLLSNQQKCRRKLPVATTTAAAHVTATPAHAAAMEATTTGEPAVESSTREPVEPTTHHSAMKAA